MKNTTSVITHLRLQKFKRLCERKDVSAVFNQSQAIRHPALILLGRTNGLHYPRLAIIVAKKNVKKATARNRLKRLIRESFRKAQHNLVGEDIVILVKKGFDKETNEVISTTLEKQWARYQKHYKKSALS